MLERNYHITILKNILNYMETNVDIKIIRKPNKEQTNQDIAS